MTTIIGIDYWKQIPEFDGYEISWGGIVRSKRQVLKQEIDKDGYRRVKLRKNNKSVHCVVSRIVAMTFIGAPEDAMVCCHNDGDVSNNNAFNLRWDTQKGNVSDKLSHGTWQIGSKHPRAEITEHDAKIVMQIIKSHKTKRGSLKAAAQQTGISYHIVADISRGKTWGHACI